MHILICPLPIFQRLLFALAEEPLRTVFARVGLYDTSPDRVWLVRDFRLSPSENDRDRAFRVSLQSEQSSASLDRIPIDIQSPSIVGQLFLGSGAEQGWLWGMVYTQDGTEPLYAVSLVGAGMHQLMLDPSTAQSLTASVSATALTRWSRTIGALGGEEVWRRLVRLRIAVVGCGRSGSLVATTLGRLGVQDLALIDPDRIELHNLGEMVGVTAVDLGQSKAQALTAFMTKEGAAADGSSSLAVRALPTSVTSDSALNACKQADVLFSCVDNDAGRLAAALVSTLYHKVLLDIGTGVHFPAAPGPIPHSQPLISTRLMGADVRLILPGSGCLLCIGGLHRYQQAVEDLCRGGTLPAAPPDWRQQRAGSLLTLNQVAAGAGIQMLLDLVAERVRESRWVRIEFDDAGRMTVQYPSVQQTGNASACALCAKAGLGDEGLRL